MIRVDLNFDWTYKYPFEETDIKGFSGVQVDLPHTNIELPKQYFSENAYQFVSVYQKFFSIDDKKNRRYFLLFEGVMSKAKVYLNETFVGEHVGGYTHFKIEITHQISTTDNRLTVVVDAIEHPDHPPFGHVVDYLTFGGIYREVTLIETAQDAIDDVHVDGDADSMNIKIYPNAKTNSLHQMSFLIKEEGKIIDSFEHKAALQDMIGITKPHQLKLWSLESPKMYELEVHIDGELAYLTPFGLRTVEVTKDGFYLNKERIFLRGLNRHQSYPYVGYAMPKRAQQEDAMILKYELGLNMVRSSHYPPSRHFLDCCDAIGLLVFTELPGWQHIGDDTWKSHALNDLKSMVMKDYNHPSVVIIGTRINESSDDHDFYIKTRDLVKSIDTTRPTGGVRFFGHSELLEDIYTVNDFIHRGNNQGVSKKKAMTKLKHPYLVTEYNGHMFPTKSIDGEIHRIEHAKRHFKVLNDAYQTKGLMGAIGWCMNDYNTHKDFGSNDHMCHHGVLDINRNNKYAAAVYASQKQAPFMEVLSMMHIGDLPQSEIKEVIVATNLDAIKVYKNDVHLGTFERKKKPYPHLPSPPIIIDDFIGKQIHDNEKFSQKDANRIKGVLLKTLRNGLKMTFFMKITLGYIMIKYKLKYQDAVRLYTTYIGGWGDLAKVYKFEGIKNGEVLMSANKGFNDQYLIQASASTKELKIAETYDVARITVELKNQLDQRAFYTSEVIEIETSDHLKIIGPTVISLQGGIQSFWVKTVKPGNAFIHIKSTHYNHQELTIEIK